MNAFTPISEHTPTEARRSVPQVAWLSAGASIAAIWLAIVLAGMAAPDFVSGSQHEHLKLVGGGDWIWGLGATAFVVVAVQLGMRLRIAGETPWIALCVGVSAVWAGVLLVSAFGPVMVTGTDPTTIPYAAMGVPILGVFLTWFVCTLVKSAFELDS